MRAAQLYLLCYNAAQAAAWSVVCARACRILASGGSAAALYSGTGALVTAAQTLTIVETLNALAGIVRSAWSANLLQFAGRTHCWLLAVSLPELQRHGAIAVLIVAWACADVIRYAWAASGSVGQPPQALTWLRYTAFILLYPLGAGAEIALLHAALPAAAGGFRRVTMPNAANVSFEYHTFLGVVLLLYPLLFLQLYAHMLRQRRKKLQQPASQKED